MNILVAATEFKINAKIHPLPKKKGSFVFQVEHENLAGIFSLAFLALHCTSERSYENKRIVYKALRWVQ